MNAFPFTLLRNKYVQALVLGWLRNGLAALVPTLIAAGVLQQNQTDDFIGAGFFLGTMLLTWLDKQVVKTKLTIAAATGEVPQTVSILKPAAAQMPPQATMQSIPDTPGET